MNRRYRVQGCLSVLVLAGGLSGARAEHPDDLPRRTPRTVEPTGATPYLTPEESLRTIELPAGYRLELVLAEPDIREPVAVTFDGNGRMYVVEMRSYMQDIDGTDEHAAISLVSRHESTKRDGRFDKHSVYLDHLVLPRMILTMDDRVVVGETDTNDLFVHRDTNGDGVADTKEVFYRGGPRGGNLEHQPNGLLWSMDNWLYSTYNSYRLRYTPKGVLKQATASNGGQWGIAQDDYGKVWFSNAGGERGLLNFQTHIRYAAVEVPEQFDPSFREVWPLVGLADVQGGKGRFRPAEKTLNHFTATCGHEVFRGDRLPEDLRGDILMGEPVGRLIRRAKVEVRDGITTLRNAYHEAEFIRSTDPNFRPINMTTGPDGTLYIVDMYRGIIQEGNWVSKGSYLRGVVQQHGLDKNFGRGRIWRLVHKDWKPGPQPRMLEEKSRQLVAHLSHPNGWWRDTAQKLLVLRGDRSVVPQLGRLFDAGTDTRARLHALWTLEGLQALDAALLRHAFKDPNPHVRTHAVRASESLMEGAPANPAHALQADVMALLGDSDPEVVLQVLGTAKHLAWQGHEQIIAQMVKATSSRGVKEIAPGLMSALRSAAVAGLPDRDVEVLQRGRLIYNELCFACHGDDGKGATLAGGPPGATIAPPLAGSAAVLGHRELAINVLLHGLSGPVAGQTYAAAMVPMRDNSDAWIASVASYVRNSFGTRASLITEEDVARVRAQTRARIEPWTLQEVESRVPTAVPGRTGWRVTASHNPTDAARAVDDDAQSGYETKTPQAPGMWFQVELPRETTVSALLLNAAPAYENYPRGFEVRLSRDGKSWTEPVASGKGRGPAAEIDFAAAKTRVIRITQTGSAKDHPWSIHDLRVLGPAS